MRRLLLVRHAPTSATRAFAFPADEPLDDRGRASATALARAVPVRFAVMCSPARRCLETVEAAGLEGAQLEPDLTECDFGSWTGRTLEAVAGADADGVGRWMTDPQSCPHGGESLAAFSTRVGSWLDRQALLDGGALAVTHGGVVKAAVTHALRAPLHAFWRIDATPLAVTELHAHDGRWTVARVNCAVPR